MAEVIKKRTGQDVESFTGRRASFEVTQNGELLFSKLSEDRFPEHDEILEKIL